MKIEQFNHHRYCLRCWFSFKPQSRLQIFFWLVLFFAAVIFGSDYLGN